MTHKRSTIWQVPGSTYVVSLWFSSKMFKTNNQLWTPLISSGPKTQPPSDCLASYVNLKAARQLGDPKMTNVMGKMMINRDILGYTKKKTSDFISETPDLFQFVVPTKAATNKQHNSTRWWVSVLSWFPHQLYISHKPYGISYTNAKFASSSEFQVSGRDNHALLATPPAWMSLHTVTLTLVLVWDGIRIMGLAGVKHLGPAMVLTHPMGFSAEEIMVSLFVTWYGYESKAWPCTPGYPWRPLK